jgi:hypothetical protein
MWWWRVKPRGHLIIGTSAVSRMKIKSPIFIALFAMAFASCVNSNGGSGRQSQKSLEQIYLEAVKYENEFDSNPNHYAEGTFGDMPLVRMEFAEDDANRFWQEYREYQNRYGGKIALSRLQRIVNANGLCMIMDSDLGRWLVGAGPFDALLLSNRGTQTKFFAYAFGKPIAQGTEFLNGFPNP